MRHHDRLKSINTPPRQDRLPPSKRRARDDDGPTPFQLQRQAEAIGASTYCAIDDRKVGMVKPIGTDGVHNFSKQLEADAQFASTCAIARVRYEEKITGRQYRAGLEYARLFYLVAGRISPKQSALAKAIAASLEERLAKEAKARREERDDDEYEEWLAERVVDYRRALYRMQHIRGRDYAEGRNLRNYINRTVVESIYPANGRWLAAVRLGLQELADVFNIEEDD